MTLGRIRKKLSLRTWYALRSRGVVRVAVCLREGAQAGARRSGGGRLHNVGQITRRLSDVHIVHESAKLVGDSVTNW